MSDWPMRDGYSRSEAGAATVNAPAGTNTESAYTTLIASTAFDSDLMLLQLESGNNQVQLADLAIGAGGAEQNLLTDLLFDSPVARTCLLPPLPIEIPAGSRVSYRHQCDTANRPLAARIRLFGGNFGQSSPRQRYSSYGPDSTTTRGVQIDPGGTANTDSAWVQLTASTVADHDGLLLAIGTINNIAPTVADWLIDLALGAGGSEVEIFSDVSFRLRSTVSKFGEPHYIYLPISIPAASRLSARAQCTITDATDRLIGVAAYGVS